MWPGSNPNLLYSKEMPYHWAIKADWSEILLVHLLNQYLLINRELPIRPTNTCVFFICFLFCLFWNMKILNITTFETKTLINYCFVQSQRDRKFRSALNVLKYFITTVFISIMCTFITSRCYKNPVSSIDSKMELRPYPCNITYQFFTLILCYVLLNTMFGVFLWQPNDLHAAAEILMVH